MCSDLGSNIDKVIVYAGLDKLSYFNKKLPTQPVDNFVDKTKKRAVTVDTYWPDKNCLFFMQLN
jgi:hypothetical protein